MRQAGVRLPLWYTESPAFAIRPSQPSRRARSSSGRPSSRTMSLSRIHFFCAGVGRIEFLKAQPARRKGLAAQVLVAVAQDVEQDERGRLCAFGALDVSGRRQVDASLDVLEPERHAARVDRDDFAVEEQRAVEASAPSSASARTMPGNCACFSRPFLE